MTTRTTVIDAMKAAYEQSSGDLAARMLVALQAAQKEDGDIRGMQSAALKIVTGSVTDFDWETVYDLRVDEGAEPLQELARLVRLRHAQLLDEDGHSLFETQKYPDALEKWAQARAEAPELEELAFWQAVTLAGAKPGDDSLANAVEALRPAVAHHDRAEQWLELLRRLQECGLIERPGAAEELIAALSAAK